MNNVEKKVRSCKKKEGFVKMTAPFIFSTTFIFLVKFTLALMKGGWTNMETEIKVYNLKGEYIGTFDEVFGTEGEED